MTSSCLLLLSVLFPLKYSVSAEATSCNGGLTLGQTGRGIDAGQVGSNVEDMVTPMHATSVQGSNSGGTTDFKSWKGHSRRTWHHRHLKNVRGALILIGWGTILPVGVMIARYSKTFPTTCKEWPSLHITFQSIGYVVGTIGWGFGIRRGNTKALRILSIIVFTFTTIQMLAIFWLPKKEHKRRRCWEIYHHSLGYAVIALIIANTLVGITNQGQAEKLKWIYVVILGVLALTALGLETFRWNKSIRLQQHSNVYTFA
ncbi:hypothetical protein CJ030_MR2G028592 [Morella rubra]|uniref:Cytochrome b561 domain-containing protein n=1 Tax=Morella rubra TaxID=262757 RepID=A0A6A1WCV1_9ROSI|nr:hypothetical protein CJ030_MR2G028592 [Morella rubra]